MTVAAFMDLALYHPELGYYACASRRSGRAGDFVTSVDLGPLFGELLGLQLADMALTLGPSGAPYTMVEAGAGDGRLAYAMFGGLRKAAPAVCSGTRLHLVERSASARAAQHRVLAEWGEQAISSDELPGDFEGVIVGNELLDAMPTHQVVATAAGLREVHVDVDRGTLVTRDLPPSSPRLAAQLDAAGVTLATGARAEVSLAAIDWVQDAAKRLQRGFMLLIDYGHEATHLYAEPRTSGTLTTYRRHQQSDADSTSWLDAPGQQDITAHVDFTSIRTAAESQGCDTLALMDQTYFLMALASPRLEHLDHRERQAFKTLVLPGGLGSTMKVLVLGKGVGRPALLGCSGPTRLT